LIAPLSFESKLKTPCRNETPQRRHNILALLNEQGEVSVDELAKRFETSEVTIRKDLAALEANGLLLRRYGGAVPCPRSCWRIRYSRCRLQAGHCPCGRERIREHARIIIDSGSTTAAMIPSWAPARPGGDDQLAQRGPRHERRSTSRCC
jgi:DNA-binding transcriptional ArsR family regulator